MEWITTKDKPPLRKGKGEYEQQDCLVFHNGEIKHLVWNCEHECWDDSTGDDFYCHPKDVDYWMPFPPSPGASNE